MCDPVTMTALVGSALSIGGSGAAAAGMTAAEVAAAGLTGGAANIAMGLGAAGTSAALTTSQLFAASLGISALSAGTSFLGQQQAASANAKSAGQAMMLQTQQDNLNTSQNEASQMLDLQQKDIQASNARATARTSAGESGTTGNSVDALIADYNMQEGQYRSAVTMQQNFNREQGDIRREGYATQAQGRVNSVPAPSIFATALSVGGSALDTYNKFYGKPEKQN